MLNDSHIDVKGNMISPSYKTYGGQCHKSYSDHKEAFVRKHMVTIKESTRGQLGDKPSNFDPLSNNEDDTFEMNLLPKLPHHTNVNTLSIRILFCDEAHFWLNGYVNKQNCRIWSEANPQVYVETPLHLEKLTVWCALWAGGILLQKR
ncbi:hypothetical protein TNCV_2450941 [Trichonephila clavipes]|nr:hypothetical protein TNCV_2450941 [Trichonephila clavipes]